MAFKRHLFKVVVCLGVGALLFILTYLVIGSRVEVQPETQLSGAGQGLLGKKELVAGELRDPDVALAWLLEGLLVSEPTLSVEHSSRVMSNGKFSWKRVWLKGVTCDINALADILELSRKTLRDEFNYQLLLSSDPNRGSLGFLIVDGYEVVVVANFIAPVQQPVLELEPDRPQLAIVIDDLGRSLECAADFASLPMSLTFAIFPQLSNSRKVARYFVARQCDIILHMPMEPLDFPTQDPGPGALFRSMSDDQLRQAFVVGLDFLPGIIGVNNHMGSCLTADAQKMVQVMDVLKGRDLFFLDSRTIADSVAYKNALAAGIPALQRDVFIDNDRDVEKIVEQFQVLIEIARVRGAAIGIGHPYPETLEALALLPRMVALAGVEIVAVQSLLKQK
ncbi:divergent polysaccharide deacetylase family protein [bacterium]|nr:divergent polysaccharide deacetylase family protein [bacterium]